jgi:hypothetical protein
MFRRALDAPLPADAPPKNVALAGPGLPAATADIALVPQHPQTGEAWRTPAKAAPLPTDVWMRLAFPATGHPS